MERGRAEGTTGREASPTPGRIAPGLALALALIAAALLALFAAWDLRVARDGGGRIPDDAISMYEAKVHAAGRFFGTPPPVEPRSFYLHKMLWVEGHQGRTYGKDYPGFPLVLAVGVAGGAPWLVNPILGALVVVATFLLGRSLRGPAVGLAAALLLASSPALFQLSASYLNHVTAMLLLTIAALALLRGSRSGRWPWALLGGLAYGWALATRPYTTALMGLAFGSFLLWRLRGNGGRSLLLAFGAGVLPAFATMLVWNAAFAGDPLRTAYEVWGKANRPRWFGGEFPFSRSIQLTWGILRGFLEKGFAVPWTLPAAAVLPLLALRRLGRGAMPFAIAGSVLIVGHLLYRGLGNPSTVTYAGRFYSEGLPAYAILTAVAGAALAAGRSRIWPGLALAIPFAFAITSATVTFPATIRTDAARADSFRRANVSLERYLQRNPGPPRLVFVDVSTYHAVSALLVNAPDYRGNDVVAIYFEPDANRRVAQAFPDRELFLFRLDAAGEPVLSAYDPATDEAGPPDRHPYTRWKNRTTSHGKGGRRRS